MAVRDLIPWNRGRDVSARRGAETDPFVTLHREMNRMFDEVMRGFNLAPFGGDRLLDGFGWPKLEITESENEVKVDVELPGIDQKDVDVELANGMLCIRGEKKAETEDKDRLFSERHYGRFERRLPVDDVEEDKVAATFRNGVLTVTLPKSAQARQKARRIAINGK